MRTKKQAFPITLSLLALLDSSALAWAKPSDQVEIKVTRAEANEQHERDVDEVAWMAQEKAISRLKNLVQKYRGTAQEAPLLMKLGDLQEQSASMLFRIAHGRSRNQKDQGKSPELLRYQKIRQDAIATFSNLISKFPNFDELARAYYSRGKAFEEIENKKSAAQDYLHLVQNYPKSDEASSAYMALAEFSIEANEHKKAIQFLEQIEKNPNNPHYPFALYKLAWSHYNLKEISQALSYAEKQIKHYSLNSKSATTTSDQALRENTLLDIPVFYFEGYEQKQPSFQIENALSYFKNISHLDAHTQGVLGRMLIRFAKLLRSHGHDADLLSWKDQVLAQESHRAESLEVAIVTYEHQLNRRKWAEVIKTVQDMVKLHQAGKRYESFARAQKMILETAENLQTLVIKNKQASEVRTYSTTLATLYEAFTQMVDEKDLRIPRIHHNLAETLFAIQDYAGATEHYRWIVDHGKWNPTIQAKSKAEKQNQANARQAMLEASLKAISSRYELLKQKKLLPNEVKAVALTQTSTSPLDPLLTQWISWMDTHVQFQSKQASSDGIENFIFESLRAQYSYGLVSETLLKFKEFIRKYPQSKFSIPAASLILDTYIASADWDKTLLTVKEFQEVAHWKKSDFSSQLASVAADASYKKVENLFKAKDYAKTIEGAEAFAQAYSKSPRIANVLTLAASAAMASQEVAQATRFYTRLIQDSAQPGAPVDAISLRNALLSRAKINENNYEFAAAAADYKSFLLRSEKSQDSEKELNELRTKLLALTWLSNDLKELKGTLESKTICTDALAIDCEKYEALLSLSAVESSQDSNLIDQAFERAHRNQETSSKETRAIWAAVALEGSKSLAFRDRHHMLRRIATGWGDLDPLVQFHLLPRLVKSIPKTFELNRLALKQVAPLRAHEKYITHRVDSIREMENAATQALKLPWARIRAEVTNQMAAVYIDLSRGLSELKAPKGLSDAELVSYQDTIRKLSMPFEEKGQDLRSKAFEIASRFAIEEDSFQRISEPFFAENPSQAKKLRSIASSPLSNQPKGLGLEYLAQVDPTGGWLALSPVRLTDKTQPIDRIKAHWAQAIQQKVWHQVAFFMQQAQQKSVTLPGVMGVVKAISLAVAGARGEALTEIDESRKNLSSNPWTFATSSLVQFYSQTYAFAKTQALSQEIEKAVQKAQAESQPNKEAPSPASAPKNQG